MVEDDKLWPFLIESTPGGETLTGRQRVPLCGIHSLVGNHLTPELGNDLTLKLGNHLTPELGNHLALEASNLGNYGGP